MIDTKQIRESVATICQKYGEEYWRNLDKKKEYPTDFVKEMTTSGFLNILIPQEYGGAGLGLKEACVVLEELSLQGAHAGACHACLLYTSPSPRDVSRSRMPSSA